MGSRYYTRDNAIQAVFEKVQQQQEDLANQLDVQIRYMQVGSPMHEQAKGELIAHNQINYILLRELSKMGDA